MTERTDIIRTIGKLRNLAEQAGEGEAMAAIRKAEKLMQAYNVGEAELAMAEAEGTIELEIVTEYQTGATKNGRNRSKAILAFAAVAKFCGVRNCYYSDYSTIEWIGHRPDVEMAKFLADLIYGALEREYVAWRNQQVAVPRSAKGSFQTAMAHRISRRLMEMHREQTEERAAAVKEAAKLLEPSAADKLRSDMATGNIKELTSTALVVASITQVKKRAVDDAFHEANPRLSQGRGWRGGYRNSTAASAGAAAGARLGLGRPVGGGNQARLT